MPKGKKHRFSQKQDRQAAHIAASEKKQGKSAKEAKAIGYATVNKQKSKKKKFNGGAYASARKKHFGIS